MKEWVAPDMAQKRFVETPLTVWELYIAMRSAVLFGIDKHVPGVFSSPTRSWNETCHGIRKQELHGYGCCIAWHERRYERPFGLSLTIA